MFFHGESHFIIQISGYDIGLYPFENAYFVQVTNLVRYSDLKVKAIKITLFSEMDNCFNIWMIFLLAITVFSVQIGQHFNHNVSRKISSNLIVSFFCYHCNIPTMCILRIQGVKKVH